MNVRKETLALTAILISQMISARERIWDVIEPWPRWWKILLAIGMGVFFTLTMIWAFGLEWLVLELIGIPYPI